MTIRLLCDYGKYPANAIVTLDAGTEGGLVTAKMATTNTTGGVPYVELPQPNQIVAANLVYDAAGALIGVTAADGKIQPLGGGAAYGKPAAPVIGTATAGSGTVTINWTPASNGGLPILAFYVELSNGRFLLAPPSATSITFYGVPNGAPVTGKVVAINLVGSGPASAASNPVTPSSAGGAVAPTVVSAPAIAGIPTAGTPSSATAGSFAGTPTPTVIRKWLLGGVEVETAASHTYSAGDVGKVAAVREIASNTGGSVSATSAGVVIAAASQAASYIGGDRLYSNDVYSTGASGPRNAIFKDEAEAEVVAVRLWIGTKTLSGTQATYQGYVAATEEGRVDTIQHQFAPVQGGVVNDSVTTSGAGFRQFTWGGQPTVTPPYVTGQGTGQSLAGYVASDWITLASVPRTDVVGGRPMFISRVSQLTAGAAYPSGPSNANWHAGRGQSFYREHCAQVPPSTATNSYPGSVNDAFGDPLYCWLEFQYAVPTRNVLIVGDSRRSSAACLFQADSWGRRGLKSLSTQATPVCATNVAGSGHSQTQFVAIATNIINNGWIGTDVLLPGFSQNGFNQGDSGASYIAAIDVLVNLCLSKGFRVLMDTDYGVNGYIVGQTNETGRQNCIQHVKDLAAQGKVTLVNTDPLITDYSTSAPVMKTIYNTNVVANVEGAAGSGDGIHCGPTAQITQMAPALAAVF